MQKYLNPAVMGRSQYFCISMCLASFPFNSSNFTYHHTSSSRQAIENACRCILPQFFPRTLHYDKHIQKTIGLSSSFCPTFITLLHTSHFLVGSHFGRVTPLLKGTNAYLKFALCSGKMDPVDTSVLDAAIAFHGSQGLIYPYKDYLFQGQNPL